MQRTKIPRYSTQVQVCVTKIMIQNINGIRYKSTNGTPLVGKCNIMRRSLNVPQNDIRQALKVQLREWHHSSIC